MSNKTKEEYYNYGKSLGIKINDLQRLKVLANTELNARIAELEAQIEYYKKASQGITGILTLKNRI